VLSNGCLLLPAGSVTPEELLRVNEDVDKYRNQKLKEVKA